MPVFQRAVDKRLKRENMPMKTLSIARGWPRLELSLAPLLVFLSTAANACSSIDESASAVGFVARDSAGITIVENDSPAWEPGLEWTVGPLQTAVGEVEGASEYQLYRVFDATRLADGTVVVAKLRH
jgi:hypothetical protein